MQQSSPNSLSSSGYTAFGSAATRVLQNSIATSQRTLMLFGRQIPVGFDEPSPCRSAPPAIPSLPLSPLNLSAIDRIPFPSEMPREDEAVDLRSKSESDLEGFVQYCGIAIKNLERQVANLRSCAADASAELARRRSLSTSTESALDIDAFLNSSRQASTTNPFEIRDNGEKAIASPASTLSPTTESTKRKRTESLTKNISLLCLNTAVIKAVTYGPINHRNDAS